MLRPQCREYVKAAIDSVPVIPFRGPDGGSILGAGNVLTEDIPLERIEAYGEAVSEFTAGFGRLERG